MGVNVNEMPKLGFGLMRLPEKDGQIDPDRKGVWPEEPS